MREVLTHSSLTARRLAAYAHHDDGAVVSMLATLILLWMLGGKLLIG